MGKNWSDTGFQQYVDPKLLRAIYATLYAPLGHVAFSTDAVFSRI